MMWPPLELLKLNRSALRSLKNQKTEDITKKQRRKTLTSVCTLHVSHPYFKEVKKCIDEIGRRSQSLPLNFDLVAF